MADNYVDQVATAIIKQLKEGTAPWQKPWQAGERFMPYNPTTGNEYRGMNAVWLMSQSRTRGFDDARWMTYRQSQEQDGQVRKGEKGTPIQFWKWQGLEPVKDASGKPVLDQEGQPVRQMVRYERPRVMGAVVFNAQQIEGLPPAPLRPVLPEWERHERAEKMMTNSGVPFRHVGGDRAFYRPAEDTITMPERSQFATGDRYYATALHELGHATGHPSRLARDLAHPFGSEGYAREELRAEIGSLMLGEQIGVGHDPSQHVAYVASWIKALEHDPREIFRASADAEKITKLILSYEQTQEQASETVRGAGVENVTTQRAPDDLVAEARHAVDALAFAREKYVAEPEWVNAAQVRVANAVDAVMADPDARLVMGEIGLSDEEARDDAANGQLDRLATAFRPRGWSERMPWRTEQSMLVPVQDADGRMWSMQKIGKDGFKSFQEGGKVEGGHFVIGDVKQPGPILIAEGFATAATLHEMTGLPAIVAFNAGNLLPIAQTYHGLDAARAIYIAGDDDRQRAAEVDAQGRPKVNVGRVKAEEAASAIGAQAVFPSFPLDTPGTDWNDLAKYQGTAYAAGQLRHAIAIGERETAAQGLAAARDEAALDQEHSLPKPVGQAIGRVGRAFGRYRTAVQELEQGQGR